jgi:hypothetical protein
MSDKVERRVNRTANQLPVNMSSDEIVKKLKEKEEKDAKDKNGKK